MEKRVAHYNLDAAKATVVQRGVDVFTKTALLRAGAVVIQFKEK